MTRFLRRGEEELYTLGLPKIYQSFINNLIINLIRKMSFDADALIRFIEENEPELLPDQAKA